MQAVKKTAVVKPDGNVEVSAIEFMPGTSVEIIMVGNEMAPQKKEKGALFRKLSQIRRPLGLVGQRGQISLWAGD